MRVILHPYKVGSASCRALQEEFTRRGVKCLRVRSDSTRYRPKPTDIIVNWGNSQLPLWVAQPKYNPYLLVEGCSDKLEFFGLMSQVDRRAVGDANNIVRIPETTTMRDVAQQWVDEGHTVLARTLLRASGGRGIVVCTTGQVVQAPLYTKYVKKKSEFRVHVFNNEVIHVQEKRRRTGVEDVDNQIRNHDNGWVFCVQNVEAPADVTDQALRAVRAAGVDFGAVDVIYNQKKNEAYVLEINTAPGLEGTTLEKYADAILANADT